MTDPIRRPTDAEPSRDTALEHPEVGNRIKNLLDGLGPLHPYRLHATAHVDLDTMRVVMIDPDCAFCQAYVIRKEGSFH